MTIRSGGRARERSQARPADPGAYDEAWQPEYVDAIRRRGGGGRRQRRRLQRLERRPPAAGSRASQVPRCSLSSSAGSSSSSLVTALRPLVRNAVVGWATDNPAALGMPFVADLVREDLGAQADRSGLERSDPGPVRRRRTATTRPRSRPSSRPSGFLSDRRAFIFLATQQGLTQQLAAGTFILRKSMTPQDVVNALLKPEQIHYVEIALRTGLRLEQITAKLETIDGLTMDPGRLLRARQAPDRQAPRRLPVAQGGPARRAPPSRASCGRRPTRSCPTRPPRSSSATCSTGSTPRSVSG